MSALRFEDQRRILQVPGDQHETISYCIDHFVNAAQEAILARGLFAVALSGGSTPKAVIQGLTSPENRDRINWSKVYIFWSDERAVAPDHPDSNYAMAMNAGLSKVAIPPHHIFRMVAEENIEENAIAYQKKIRQITPSLDLVLLGMGDDGHTASLFPGTAGLIEQERLVIANAVPQKECMRMTFTYRLINNSRAVVLYVMGAGKGEMLKRILVDSDHSLPATAVGTATHKALWIADTAAARLI